MPYRSLPLLALAGLSLAGACATSGGHRDQAPSRVEAAMERVENASVTTTVFDAHRPTVRDVEMRLALGTTGAAGLLPAEIAQLRDFANDYLRVGRGNVVFSVPTGSVNAAGAGQVVSEAQRLLFAEGVDYARMTGGAYQAAGQQAAPVIVAFVRSEAQAADCPPWSQIDPRKTASNLNSPRFGCAQAGNLAAMIVDPQDLLGDRRDGTVDADVIQRGVAQRRAGEIPTASGTVAGGN